MVVCWSGMGSMPPPDFAGWPAGVFFTGDDVELGSFIFGGALMSAEHFLNLTGRRTEPIGAQILMNDEIPKVSFNKIAIYIHMIIPIGLRGDTYKSSWDVATKPFS